MFGGLLTLDWLHAIVVVFALVAAVGDLLIPAVLTSFDLDAGILWLVHDGVSHSAVLVLGSEFLKLGLSR